MQIEDLQLRSIQQKNDVIEINHEIMIQTKKG